MQDHPTVAQLLDAVRRYLEEEIVPNTDGRRQFLARVSANTLQIVLRELEAEEEHLEREWAGLERLLGPMARPATRAELRAALRARNEELCRRIRAGEADGGEWSRRVWEHVRTVVRDKISVTNPGFLAPASP